MTRFIRPIRTEGNTAFVTLTRGQTAIIDAEDAPLVEHWNWSALFTGGRLVYAVRAEKRDGKTAFIYLHRWLMNAPEGKDVDHVSGDTKDNRRANLRVAEHAQNLWNRGKNQNNRSGFKGVSWITRDKRWSASIVVNGRKHHLGYHHTAEAAHEAYCAASAEYHRDFGRVVDFERPSEYPCAFRPEDF